MIENFLSVLLFELWDRIEEEFDKFKKKKRVIFWWLVVVCFLLGLLIFFVLNFNFNFGIEIINNGLIEKSVVFDENKNDLNNNKIRFVEKNNIEKKFDVVENLFLENIVNLFNNI